MRSMVDEGLYEKEARAMVATWKGSWLDEPGTRVLYLLPRRQTMRCYPSICSRLLTRSCVYLRAGSMFSRRNGKRVCGPWFWRSSPMASYPVTTRGAEGPRSLPSSSFGTHGSKHGCDIKADFGPATSPGF